MLDRMQLRVRRATAADAAALADLARRTFAQTFAADNTPEDLAHYLARAYGIRQQAAELADARIHTLLAEIEAEPVAFAQLRQGRPPAGVTGDSPLEVWRFYVDAGWQGRGVAGMLMQAVERAAHSLTADSLWLGVWERNARAIAFYEKHGYVRVGEKDFVLGADRQRDWVMARALTRGARRDTPRGTGGSG